MTRKSLLCMVFAALTLFTSVGVSAIFHVPGDHPNIRGGILAAGEGDTVLVAPGTYIGSVNRGLEFDGKNITVMGSGGSDATILDCQNLDRGFFIHEGESDPFISGFTIINGRAIRAGGIYILNASADMSDIKVIDCSTSSMHSGGIFISDTISTCTLSNVHLEGNTAASYAGAISINDGVAELFDVTVVGNSALGSSNGYGGGIACFSSDVIIDGATIVGNSAELQGGALIVSLGSVIVRNSVIAFNEADDAAVYAFSVGNLTLECSDVYGNTGGNYGGEIPDQTGLNGNISSDPLFCGWTSGDFTLHALSPCLPANNDCIVLMGAHGQGCGEAFYFISGDIVNQEGDPLWMVEILGGPEPETSDVNGHYDVRVPEGWNGTLTPFSLGYTFIPPERSYVNVTADIGDQDYEAFLTPITLHVPGDYPTIQDAIDAAVPGDTILVAPGSYSGPGFMNIDFYGRPITLIGEGGSAQTIIEGILESNIFHIRDDEGPGTLIQGFTLTCDGMPWMGQAAMKISDGSPTLRDLVFHDCWSGIGGIDDSYATALYIAGVSAPLVEDCVFIDNAAEFGGAVYSSSLGSPVFRNVLFENNHALIGGAVLVNDGTPIFENVVFRQNVAISAWTDDVIITAGSGGAVFCACDAVFDHCLFANNHAEGHHVSDDYNSPRPGSGGGMTIIDASPIIRSSTLHGNSAEKVEDDIRGGGIRIIGSSLPIFEAIVLAFSTEGGGIYSLDESIDIACSDVYGNADGDYAGALVEQTGLNGNISADPIFCDSGSGDFRLDASSPCLPPHNDCFVQMGANGLGCGVTAVATEASTVVLSLEQNHPNPFNPRTDIRFHLPAPGPTDLRIYDAQGRCVSTLHARSFLEEGWHTASWHGKDDAGRALSSGVYFCKLVSDSKTETMKMLMLR